LPLGYCSITFVVVVSHHQRSPTLYVRKMDEEYFQPSMTKEGLLTNEKKAGWVIMYGQLTRLININNANQRLLK